MFKNGEKLWAVVPAAGQGRRVGGAVPKQYLEIAGIPVLAHSLNRLAAVQQIDAIFVGISETDRHWQKLPLPPGMEVACYTGGQSRAETVWLGLQALQECASADDWVLVHDAARPCVQVKDIDALISAVVPSFEGGLLAVPVTDTIKVATQDSTTKQTMDRRMLWRAQTPQLFRYSVLCTALQAVVHDLESISDESAAVEKLGLNPLIVQSAERNIKITNSKDLQLAEFFLGKQS
ncbi:MAG: 2-C-methyl-D-erythritol 4-phosphate cytidylyltransferase [Arenicellales bacterium]|nr:2-C-methyl-D-erythritol 4-phosphate cytidylyltransferase [Arenicellales bacterium]